MILAFLLAAATAGAAPEEAAVRDLWKRFAAFYNERNADGIARLYAADADRLTEDGNANGRAEIRAQYVAELAQPGANDAPLDERIAIRFLRPDVALIDGEADYASDSGVITYFYTVVVVKADGLWLIAAGRPRGSVKRAGSKDADKATPPR